MYSQGSGEIELGGAKNALGTSGGFRWVGKKKTDKLTNRQADKQTSRVVRWVMLDIFLGPFNLSSEGK